MSSTEFDFESFIAGISSTQVTVEVSAVDHSYEIEQLEQMLASLPEDEPAQKRAAQKSPRTLITQQIAALRAEEDAAPGMSFRLRPLTPDEWKSLYEDGDGDGEDTRYRQLSWQCVEPKLSPEQWKQLGARLELPRFGRIMKAATELSLREGKSPAFSQSASAGRLNLSKS